MNLCRLSITMLIGFTLAACETKPNPMDRDYGADLVGSRQIPPGTRWESAAWDPFPGDTWAPLAAGSRVRFYHPLSRTPANVFVYLSYSSDGSHAVPSAGDSARIEEVTDEYVEIFNRTAQSFYVRIVLD